MLRSLLTPLAALAVLALALAGPAARAQTVPFKVTGGGLVDFVPVVEGQSAFHFATGKATQLGKYYGEGTVRVDRFTSPTTAEFSSAEPFVFVAANGDELAFHYGRTDFGAEGPGVVELFPVSDTEVVAVWTAEFTPVPGESTGRFARVTGGSFVMVAVTEPFVPGSTDPVEYTWSGEGKLVFRKGRR